MTAAIDVLAKVIELLGGYVGEATGGSTTTLQDSNNTPPDDYFNGGVIAFLSGDNADISTRITDYANTNGQFTFATQSNALADGDRYVAIPAPYNRSSLISAINSALHDIGDVGQYTILSVSETDQEEYTLPTGVKNVAQVDEPIGSDDDDNPIEFVENPYFIEVDGKIVFDYGHVPKTDYVRIWYNAPHGDIQEDDDDINDGINLLMLAWTAVYYAASRRLNKPESAEPKLQTLLSVAAGEKERLRSLHPPTQIIPSGKLADW